MTMTTNSLTPEQLRLAINLRLGLLGCSPVTSGDGVDLTGV
ncbi:MAG: hypothetical protein K0R17_2209, partial [Rariglobus sp.]|nr:hypothetical protein [Rariglobus sp.]